MDQLSIAAHLRSLANPISGPLGDLPLADRPRVDKAGEGRSFGEILREQIAEVNSLQTDADQAIGDLVTGRSDDIHGTMIALQKADVSFRLLMAVRNKLLDAYEEVMRMQI